MSIVIKPEPEMEERVVVLAHLLAVCLCRVLESLGVDARIKWPNDVMADGLKLAGILAESATYGTKFAGMVAGVGVNLNMDAATLSAIDKPATALNLLLGGKVDVVRFRNALLDEFFDSYEPFMREGFVSIREEYLRRSTCIGKNIEVRHGDLVISGTAVDVGNDGALRVLTAGGAVQTVAIGEMFAV
jgi:BirA family biotin operon repressor/biotin-[acetyl-CoA-carboxylase] ligase